MLDPDQPVLVAVSGGPDSLCLLDLIHNSGYSLVVAHCNHGLRSEAGDDAQAVRQEAEERALPFVLGEEDVKTFATDNAMSIEEAARIVRYRFLFAQAEIYKVQAVAVGHTADDQIETVLMHLLRGSGLSGLKGMSMRALPNAWSKAIPLVRPLLPVWREEVLAYCREQNLKPVIDRTNLDTAFYRNRLRHELIPYLEEYNPAIKQVLNRTIQVLAGDYEVVEIVTEEAWEAAILEQGQDYVAIDPLILEAQPVGVQRQLFRRAIATLRPGLRDIDYDSIERGLSFLERPTQSNQIDLVAGLRLLLEGDRVWLASWEADLPSGGWPQLMSSESSELQVPGEMNLLGGWSLHASKVPQVEVVRSQVLENADPYQAWVGMGSLKSPIIVRTRRPGDRFKPLGMKGQSIKLSEFMINVKMPRRARDTWPLVYAGDDIVWVPGYRLGHPYRITPATNEAIYLRLICSPAESDKMV